MPPELRAGGYHYAGLSCPGGYKPRRVWLQEIECILADAVSAENPTSTVRSILRLKKVNDRFQLKTDSVQASNSGGSPLRVISDVEEGLMREALFLADSGRQPPAAIERMLPQGFVARHTMTGFDVSGDGENNWLIFGEHLADSGSRDYRQLMYSSRNSSFELVFVLAIAPVQDKLGVLDVREWRPRTGCAGVRIEYVSEIRDFDSADRVHLYDVQFILHCKPG